MEKVLVVDDNIHNCELMLDLLTNWGYTAKAVYQGTEAIAAARDDCPDIILLDVMLPGMNGFEVCHEIKNNPQTCNIPIIMLTVLSDAEDRIQGLRVGADYFLAKPFNYTELKFRLTALLQQKQRIDTMEEGDAVVSAFLMMMKLRDNALYLHSCQVREYCEKVSRILLLSDRQHKRLCWAASLHDIGKVIDSSPRHSDAGRQITVNLKMGEWLSELIFHHHDIAPWHTVESEVLNSVDRFVNLFVNLPDKQKCLDRLRQDCEWGAASLQVVEALEQVLRDEQFMERLTGRFS